MTNARRLLVVGWLLLAAPVSAASITAPLIDYITITDLKTVLALYGPLVWRADGDMQALAFFDEEPGHGATVRHPSDVLEMAEGLDWTTATLTWEVARHFTCGRWQLDFEMYPLDGSTLKSLLIDTEVACFPSHGEIRVVVVEPPCLVNCGPPCPDCTPVVRCVGDCEPVTVCVLSCEPVCAVNCEPVCLTCRPTPFCEGDCTPVPEPTTLGLVGLGLLMVARKGRR
jgi:hypothetical protein